MTKEKGVILIIFIVCIYFGLKYDSHLATIGALISLLLLI